VKQAPEDAAKLENGPIDKRGCTDILCCLLFIGNIVVMIYVAAYGVANGAPLLLTAVY
jgi:hypothetical protein